MLLFPEDVLDVLDGGVAAAAWNASSSGASFRRRIACERSGTNSFSNAAHSALSGFSLTVFSVSRFRCA